MCHLSAQVFRFDTGILHDSCAVFLLKTLSRLSQCSFFMPDFVSHLCLQFSVSRISNKDLLNVNRGVAESCCSTVFSCAFSWFWANRCFFEFPVLIPLVYWIWFAQCQQKAPWIVFLVFDLDVPSNDLELINIWFMALIPLALDSFRLWFAGFQQETL